MQQTKILNLASQELYENRIPDSIEIKSKVSKFMKIIFQEDEIKKFIDEAKTSIG